MALYPTTLFHFTNQQALYDILGNNFSVSYAREKIIGPNNEKEFAVPMVSFCDLKLSELKYFLGYGRYGIGLTKEWANRNGLSPVMYINRHSQLMDGLINGVDEIYNYFENQDNPNGINNIINGYNNVINSYRYIKNYRGELWRHGQLEDDDYLFADEREWRFVPDIGDQTIRPFVNINLIRTSADKNRFNQQANHVRLSFNPDDIMYLVVENDDEIEPLIDHLQIVKQHFTPTMIKKLTSRILTVDQIENDI
jgi:hypothetical protein